MHPIVSAYLEWQHVHEMGLPYNSWYFDNWLRICAEARNWLNEVWLHETGAMS